MDSVIDVMRNFIGDSPDYFLVGNSYTPQWDYGAILEYSFACMFVLLGIMTVFKFFIKLMTK